MSLHCQLEDYSKEFLSGDLRSALMDLDVELGILMKSQSVPEQDKRRFRNLCSEMVGDMILLSVLTPVRITDKGKGSIRRQAIEVFGVEQLIKRIRDWARGNTLYRQQPEGNWQKDTCLRGLCLEGYRDFSILQRALVLSLTMIKGDKYECQRDALFSKILHRKDLEEWMFACDEVEAQDYMTTCVGAVMGQQIAHRVQNLATMLATTKKILSIAERLVQEKYVPYGDLKEPSEESLWDEPFPRVGGQLACCGSLGETRSERALNTLDHISKRLDRIEEKVWDLASSDKRTDTRELRKIQQDWSRYLQKILSVMDPRAPISLTRLQFKGGALAFWINGLAMFPLAVIQTFIPGLPKWSTRLEGIDADLAYTLISQVYDCQSYEGRVIHSLKQVFPDTDLKPLIMRSLDDCVVGISTRVLSSQLCSMQGEHESKKPIYKVFLQYLWEDLVKQGGLMLTVNLSWGKHCVFLKAFRRGDEQLFLIANPIKKDFDVYTFDEMRRYFDSGDVFFPVGKRELIEYLYKGSET